MIRAEILVHGQVQRAGYKDFIDEVAFNLNINGNVRNLEDGTVQIICEGEEDKIKELLEKININQYPIRVKRIDVEYKTITGEFDTFEIIREEDLTKATYERMDSAARYMREMNLNLGNKIDAGFNKMDENFKSLDTKYKLISEGMFAIVNELKETNKMLEDRLVKVEDRVEKTEKNIETLLETLVQLVQQTGPK